MSITEWVRAHDPGYAALRRAGRTALVMPALFAIGDKVLDNPVLATFAAFGSFALLLLVDFTGPMRDRLQDQAALAAVGGLFVVLGTLASHWVWLAAVAMVVVGFCVIFVGVVSSVLASASTALLLAFILPVTFAGPVSSIPDRLAGWGLASGASLLAIALLWPAPSRDPLRVAAIAACRALAARLRSDVAYLLGGDDAPSDAAHDEEIAAADAAAAALHHTFIATPYRPTGLGTAARSIVRLVDEIAWLQSIVIAVPTHLAGTELGTIACPVRAAAAAVLERGTELLIDPGRSSIALHDALGELQAAIVAMEERLTKELPVDQFRSLAERDLDEAAGRLVTALDPTFRAQELAFVVSQIGSNIDLAAAADRRSFLDRVTGRQPGGLSPTRAAVQERAGAHVERHSVWLHNSLRGAVGLGIAVLVANLAGVQHSFWVVLGTLSVLRSNALNTGQNVLRGLLGTAIGVVIGGAAVWAIGSDTTLLWALLPVSILIAGFAPAAISFAAGQAAFTTTLVILYNIIAPAGWQIGLLRIEDIAIGGAVSIVVGLLFWPRGAAEAFGDALAGAYGDSARYLASAVAYGMGRCDRGTPTVPPPVGDASRAAASSRRLDDAFRGYLAERGTKPLPLSEVATLVTGVAALRLGGDAVLDLWQRDNANEGDRAGARREIITGSQLVTQWYEEFATSLVEDRSVPQPLTRDTDGLRRLLDAVGRDLSTDEGEGTSTAVRMIWTNDHLDAARRLQATLIGPASTAVEDHALTSSLHPMRKQVAATSG